MARLLLVIVSARTYHTIGNLLLFTQEAKDVIARNIRKKHVTDEISKSVRSRVG